MDAAHAENDTKEEVRGAKLRSTIAGRVWEGGFCSVSVSAILSANSVGPTLAQRDGL